MRMYAVFEKGERLRHIGHLDILRTVQRALRRSGLQVKYSQGFNPHILLGFASALSVGAAAENELMEVELEEAISPEALSGILNSALPADIRVKKCGVLPDSTPSLMALVSAAAWHVRFLGDEREELLRQMTALMDQKEIMSVRKTKKAGEKDVDIRPSILAFEPLPPDSFDMTLSQEEGSTCKPSMVLEALKRVSGRDEIRVSLTRTSLLTRTGSGLERLEEYL